MSRPTRIPDLRMLYGQSQESSCTVEGVGQPPATWKNNQTKSRNKDRPWIVKMTDVPLDKSEWIMLVIQSLSLTGI